MPNGRQFERDAGRVAVGDGDRALRIGDVVEAADDERVYAIVGNEFERRGPDDPCRQIGGEIGKDRALVRGAEQIACYRPRNIAAASVDRARCRSVRGLRPPRRRAPEQANRPLPSCSAKMPGGGARDQHVRIVARTIGDLGDRCSAGSPRSVSVRSTVVAAGPWAPVSVS